MDIRVTAPERVNTRIKLTGSKSECNRALIIAALSNGRVKVENMSNAADSEILAAALMKVQQYNKNGCVGTCEINIGHAGTAMRFLTAYLCLQQGEYLLSGSARMLERPIGVLAEALKSLGADIKYEGSEGYPPLRIKGGIPQDYNNVLQIAGGVSSQYISALLMIAPLLSNGLKLCFTDTPVSKPYIYMTLGLMQQAGIHYIEEKDAIYVPHNEYKYAIIHVEPDWSAASYWYEIAALIPYAVIWLPGLRAVSYQGDRRSEEYFSELGVQTIYENNGVTLRHNGKVALRDVYDFTECPDIAQSFITAGAALRLQPKMTGLQTLRIKETDRITALQQELAKFNVRFYEAETGIFTLDYYEKAARRKVIDTYEDHRMAMALAPMACVDDDVVIADAEVVEKSYPAYWQDLRHAGFKTEDINGR